MSIITAMLIVVFVLVVVPLLYWLFLGIRSWMRR
jgi:hypothetical protein